jgi:hypothetical protein
MVTSSLRLNCMAMRRELIRRSRGSPWRVAIERRRAIRYPLQFPTSFSWEDGEGIVRQGEGHTRNVSENGAFVEAAILPSIGSSVEMHFSLPSVPNAESKMYVQFTGETLRLEGTEQGKHSGGFAITSRKVVWHDEEGKDLDGTEGIEN